MLSRTVFRVLVGSPNKTVTALSALDLIGLLIHCMRENSDTIPLFATLLMDFLGNHHFGITLSSGNLVKRSLAKICTRVESLIRSFDQWNHSCANRRESFKNARFCLPILPSFTILPANVA